MMQVTLSGSQVVGADPFRLPAPDVVGGLRRRPLQDVAPRPASRMPTQLALIVPCTAEVDSARLPPRDLDRDAVAHRLQRLGHGHEEERRQENPERPPESDIEAGSRARRKTDPGGLGDSVVVVEADGGRDRASRGSMMTAPETVGAKIRRSRDSRAATTNWSRTETATSVASRAGPSAASRRDAHRDRGVRGPPRSVCSPPRSARPSPPAAPWHPLPPQPTLARNTPGAAVIPPRRGRGLPRAGG